RPRLAPPPLPRESTRAPPRGGERAPSFGGGLRHGERRPLVALARGRGGRYGSGWRSRARRGRRGTHSLSPPRSRFPPPPRARVAPAAVARDGGGAPSPRGPRRDPRRPLRRRFLRRAMGSARGGRPNARGTQGGR